MSRPTDQGAAQPRTPGKSSDTAAAATTLGHARVAPSGSLFRKRWWLLAVGLVLGALAWFFDQPITNFAIVEERRDWVKWVLWLPTAASLWILIIAILASFPNRGRLIVGFLCPVFLSALVTHVMKFAIGRGRPDLGVGPQVFDPFNWFGEYQSFPSGHSSAAATVAILLGVYFPTARWVFYCYAAVVGLERIIHNRHYTSDVLIGFVIGILAVYVCARWLGDDYYRKDLSPAAGAATHA
jgi:membrane-associated phospholipid phosphatase